MSGAGDGFGAGDGLIQDDGNWANRQTLLASHSDGRRGILPSACVQAWRCVSGSGQGRPGEACPGLIAIKGSRFECIHSADWIKGGILP